MSVATNSHVFSSGSFSNDGVCFMSCPTCMMPDNFVLAVKYCEFYFVVLYYFICLNILKLCSGTKLNKLKKC